MANSVVKSFSYCLIVDGLVHWSTKATTETPRRDRNAFQALRMAPGKLMNDTVTPRGLPEAQGLYDPAQEHDSCGIGFVANIKGQKSHEIIVKGIQVLINLTHRGVEASLLRPGESKPPGRIRRGRWPPRSHRRFFRRSGWRKQRFRWPGQVAFDPIPQSRR